MKTTHNTLQSMIQGTLPDPQKLAALIDAHSFEVEESLDLPNGDTQYDIAVLPDRASDCLCSYGIAREVAALCDLELLPVPRSEIAVDEQIEIVPVVIEPGAARRYMARRVQLSQSVGQDAQLSHIVESYGQRSINAVVDASNVVMFHWGQPTHAFDADKIVGGITVRKCGIQTDFLALDGNTYTLLPDDIVIADDEKILAIAGVKGGLSCAVTSETKNLVLEVANFYPALVRKTARRLNLITDAAKRYENNFSDVDADVWMEYFTGLLVSHIGVRAGSVTDIWQDTTAQTLQTLILSNTLIEKIMGKSFSDTEVQKILSDRGFSAVHNNDDWSVTISHFRRDIDCAEAIVDEIARHYGYQMGSSDWSVTIGGERKKVTLYKLSRYCALSLIERGYQESITYSFTETGDVYVAGSVAEDKSALRNTLAGLFESSLQKNYHNRDVLGVTSIRQFEIGAVFTKDVNTGQNLPFQDLQNSAYASDRLRFLQGQVLPEVHKNAMLTRQGEDVRLIVGILAAKQKGVKDELFKIVSDMLYECGLTEIAIRESVVNHTDAYIELSLSTIVDKCTRIPEVALSNDGEIATVQPFKSWSMYPSISRDISVWVPEAVSNSDLESIYIQNGGEYFLKVFLIDEFSREGRTSYAHRLVFQSQERTLSDDDVAPSIDAITAQLIGAGYEVR